VTATVVPTSESTPGLLRAAFVRRPHGVTGELRVEPLGGDSARFAPGLVLRREDDGAALRVRSARGVVGGDVLLRLDEVSSRDAAEQLRGVYLCVEHADLRSLGDDEWFLFELIGLRVRSAGGEIIGTVEDLEDYTEQQVLVVRGDGGRVTRLPFVRAFVERVDVDAGVIDVLPWQEEVE
jgi:16S rRNA processing protein RimM